MTAQRMSSVCLKLNTFLRIWEVKCIEQQMTNMKVKIDRLDSNTHYKANAHLIEAVWEQIYGFKADEQAKAASKTNLIFAGV